MHFHSPTKSQIIFKNYGCCSYISMGENSWTSSLLTIAPHHVASILLFHPSSFPLDLMFGGCSKLHRFFLFSWPDVSWVLWATLILSFSSNLQELGGVRFGLDNGMPFSFLCTTQESKKCSKFGNWANTCSSRCIEKYMSKNLQSPPKLN